MVNHSTYDRNTIIVADRGYESYNVFAHLHEKGLKYLIRVKDNAKRSIVTTLDLPNEEEFDTNVNLIITRKRKYYGNDMYKYLPSNCNFDFADLQNKEFYNMSFRVVRFKIPNDSFETIITNLDPSEFTPSDINTIYNMRWGIETSFRALKYSVGLSNFHSKKVGYITQEIFARLIMYNFCEMITSHVIVSKNSTKHIYKANFTLAIVICKQFLRLLSNHHPPDVEALINKYILPIRDGRAFVRKIKTRSSVSFLYRIA
jgi:IS4 transposase